MTPFDKKSKRRIAATVRALLCERFPLAFAGPGESKPPLKRNIHRDIKDALPELMMGEIGIAIRDYTHGETYRRNLVAGAARIDLYGFPVDIVTAEDEQRSRDVMEKMRANGQYKVAAE